GAAASRALQYQYPKARMIIGMMIISFFCIYSVYHMFLACHQGLDFSGILCHTTPLQTCSSKRKASIKALHTPF
ncbi:MAG: hypothetical protein Q8P78_00995, partial [bacterium]|nr:hypothetical protein [bacterium]